MCIAYVAAFARAPLNFVRAARGAGPRLRVFSWCIRLRGATYPYFSLKSQVNTLECTLCFFSMSTKPQFKNRENVPQHASGISRVGFFLLKGLLYILN